MAHSVMAVWACGRQAMPVCVLLVLLILGAGCADRTGATLANPHNYCVEQGLEPATPGFDDCMQSYIAEVCEQRGYGSDPAALARCADQLREGAFVRDQLEIRGF